MNDKGEMIKIDLLVDDELKLNEENCYKEKIMNLRYIEPIIIDNRKQNVEIPFAIRLAGL
jgi:hypothetical protein